MNSVKENGYDAIFNDQDVFVLSDESLCQVKEMAKQSAKKRARICLHHDHSDTVQEMVIAFAQGSEIPVHRHPPGKSESFHVLEGLLSVLLYDDKGQCIQRIELGDALSSRPSIYRLSGGQWHSMELESEMVVLHEVASGPFDNHHTQLLSP